MKPILIVLSLFIASSVSAIAAPVLLVIQVPAAPITLGQVFAIDINVAGAADLFDWQVDLNYSNLSILSVSEGPFLGTAGSTFFFEGFDDPVGGTLSTVLDTLFGATGASGSGTLFEVSAQALALGPITLALSNVILQDSSGGDIPFSTAPASVQVTGVPEPPTYLLCLTLMFATLLACCKNRGRSRSSRSF